MLYKWKRLARTCMCLCLFTIVFVRMYHWMYVHIILRCYFKHFKTTQSPQIMGEKRKIPKGQKKYWDQATSSQSNVSLKLRTTSESSTFDLFTACNAGCTKLCLREDTDTFPVKSFSMAHSWCNVCIAITFLHSAHVFRCYVQEMSCQQKLETKNKSSSQVLVQCDVWKMGLSQI